MKKLLLKSAVVAATVLTVSCQKQESVELQNVREISAVLPSEDSKVSMTQGTESLSLLWEEGDNLTIIGSSAKTYTLVSGEGTNSAVFSGEAVYGTTFTAIIPGSFTSEEAFSASSYEGQIQTGNASTAHLSINAIAKDLASYETIDFADAKKSGVIKFHLQLPAGVTSASKVALKAEKDIFYSTNAETPKVSELSLSLANCEMTDNILTAYMNTSIQEAVLADGDKLTVSVLSGDNVYTKEITPGAVTFQGGASSVIKLNNQNWTVKAYLAGEGTQTSPYLLYDTDDLLAIKDYFIAGQKVYFKVMADIDMTDVSWTPLNAAEPYTNIIDFDGNDKTISNFASSNTHYGGFFGVLYGECHDVTFKDAVISSNKDDCGVLGGYIGTNGKPGVVRNVKIEGAKVTVTYTSGYPAGIVASNAYNGTFEGCSVSGELINNSTYASATCATGGYVGKAVGGTVKFSNCSFNGTVTSKNKQKYTGGIVGWSAATNVIVDKCRIAGTINASAQRVGSVVGHWNTGTISNTSSTATISASGCSNVAGLVGLNQGLTTVEKSSYSGKVTGFDCIGGIVGNTEGVMNIINCYTQGSIQGALTSGGQCVGGICGELRKGSTVKNCYSTMDIKAYQVIGSIVGRACGAGWSKDTDYSNVVEKCIAWASKIETTRKNEDGGSSGAVIGFASRYNTYTDNFRNPNMDFQGSWADKGTPVDQDNVTAAAPLTVGTCAGNSWSGFNYIYPYHGKAASSTSTVSAVAQTLNWDANIWDFANVLPVLK